MVGYKIFKESFCLECIMKEFEIWVEGHEMSGQAYKATKLGTVTGDDFKMAVAEFMDGNDYTNVFDSGHMTFWGCRIFDNEEDARKLVG